MQPHVQGNATHADLLKRMTARPLSKCLTGNYKKDLARVGLCDRM